MVESLRHRGPDDGGVVLDGDVGLGMRRLKVVDLDGGRQPMTADDIATVVFNGEVYNHATLRAELESKGHRFRSRSDTEVILRGFLEWDVDVFRRLNGMFAIAIWDRRDQRLILGRDRIGIKPLYVHWGEQGLTFGSELKAVLGAPWVRFELDLDAIDDFLTYEFVPAPRSLIAGVEKLEVGTYLVCTRDSTTPRRSRYWTLTAGAERPTSIDQAASGVRDMMSKAVDRRLMADVPLGAFLSGGVDSSIIVGLMTDKVSEIVRSFSLGFDDPSYDELHYARTVAEHYGTNHRDQQVTVNVVDTLDGVLDALDEPFGDVSAFPMYLISRMAREDVTVVLSGDGGDELFAGYDAYKAQRWARRLQWLTHSPLGGVMDRVLDGIPPTSKKKGLTNKAKRFLEGAKRPTDLEHARWWVFWDLEERKGIWTGDALRQVQERDPFGFYRTRMQEAERNGFHGVQRQLYADVTGYLVDDILVKVDRMSMAHSLEARVPFLDHEFVEYAMSIPAEWKLRGNQTKWILKRAFANTLPRLVQRRGKEGFSIPMKNWLRGPLQNRLRDTLSSERIRARGWFNEHTVTQQINEHVNGTHNHAHRLWCLMALELSIQRLETRVTERSVLSAGRAI